MEKDAGNINFKFMKSFIFSLHVLSMDRTFKMEAGTGTLSCHPSRWKMVVSYVDPALVVPCWWDQLTSLGGLILLYIQASF